MIFRRILIHEMAAIASIVFIILLVLIMSTQVVRLLGQAAADVLVSSAVWAMMGFAAVRYFPILLSLTLFIAVLASLTRAYKDHEMIIWQAGGQSLRAFIKPVLQFAGFPILLIALLSMMLSPWALRESKSFRRVAERQEFIARVPTGIFRESHGTIYFIENFLGISNTAHNIFVQRKNHNKLEVIFAQSGTIKQRGKDKILYLQNGYQYQGVLGQSSYIVHYFKKAVLPVQWPEHPIDPLIAQTMSTLALLKSGSPAHWAEFHARLALPISAILLVIMAIPLAYYNSRIGGFVHLICAVFVFFLYQNMINIVQHWIIQEKLPVWIGVWPAHFLAALIAWGLFAWRGRLQ